MKRLLMSLVSMFAVIALTGSAASAAARFWKVQISDPAATTDKSLNIDYNVSSTIAADTFTVELFENGASKGTQTVTHPYGNSGVFTITIPAAGSYSYMVRATNHGAGDATKDSSTVTVQVSDAPQPTVTTITVTQAAPTAQTAAAQGGGVGGAGAAAVGGGQVAGAETGAATTTATPAQTTTEGTNGANNAGSSVLGAEATAKDKAVNNTKRNYAIGSVVLLLAAGVAYALYRRRALS